LDLLKFPASCAAQLRARTPEIVGCDARNASRFCVRFDEPPHDLFKQHLPVYAVGAGSQVGTHARQPSHAGPRIDRKFHPVRHWSGANPTVHADKIDDAPTTVALLDMGEVQRSRLRSP